MDLGWTASGNGARGLPVTSLAGPIGSSTRKIILAAANRYTGLRVKTHQ